MRVICPQIIGGQSDQNQMKTDKQAVLIQYCLFLYLSASFV